MFSILKHRDYRLLWLGQSISQLGDQFHLIALPWLVLTITHDPVQLGIVLALAGIPREGFGFSRNPPIRFGAPRFAAARFTVTSDANQQQIRMRYIF